MRILLAVAVVGVVATESRADDIATLKIAPTGMVVLESANAEVRAVGGSSLVDVTLVLASRRDDITGRIDLDLPRESRILAMSYSQGGEQVAAAPLHAAEARRRFAEISGTVDTAFDRPLRDPALLEWGPEIHNGRRYLLSVFPMSSFERTTVVVTFAAPRFRELAITEYDRAIRSVKKLTQATDADADRAVRTAAVGPTYSLYAAPAELPVAYPALRSVVATTHDQLRRCLGYHGRTRPIDLVVKFAIEDDGTTLAPKVTGGWRDLNACIAAIAQTWRFEARLATSTPIRYPLHVTP